MRQAVFVFLVGITVIGVLCKETEAQSGQCTCMCCTGSGCRPAILPSFSVSACSSCTDTKCRAVYPNNCPSASAVSSTSARCSEDPTTTTRRSTSTRKVNDECFASDAILQLTDGRTKKMADLVVGDLVYVKRNDEIVASPILTVFRHYRSITRFLDIYTTGSQIPLRLTPLHSLMVLPRDHTRERYLFAEDISVGDFVFSSDLRLLKIINIQEALVYNDSGHAPLTFEGTIVVNDIVASCYATHDHSMMHIITTPIRWWFFMLFELRQFLQVDYMQKLTTNTVVSFVDFYLSTRS